jgi:hypothetical protein
LFSEHALLMVKQADSPVGIIMKGEFGIPDASFQTWLHSGEVRMLIRAAGLEGGLTPKWARRV